MERGVRRPHLPAAAPHRLEPRLDARGLHHGPEALQGRHRIVRAHARGGAHLPRQPARQLVVPAQVGHQRHRGGLHRPGVAHHGRRAQLQGEGRVRRHLELCVPLCGWLRRDRGGNHAPGDNAGRHGCGGAPRRPALQGAARQDSEAPFRGPRDSSDLRRRACGHGLRHGCSQDHARARPQRLRDGQAPRARVHFHPHRRWQDQCQRRRQVCGHAALRGAQDGACGARGGGALPRRGGQQDAPGPVLALQGRDRADDQAAVVGRLQGHGGGRVRGCARRAPGDHPQDAREDVV
mmetsp:Transcript_9507/g.29788  ORF Transcript_9507/g.29788 Transcript_9507/m.29788 type:complete len:293 (+) Transcript_9507:396-1274(+)